MEDYMTDPFMVQRNRLNNLFGREYVDANPVLIAAAVLADKLESIRVEMTRLRLEMKDND